MAPPTFTQPEALRLADALETPSLGTRKALDNAAAELRRLHAANIDCVDHFNVLKAERDACVNALYLYLKAGVGNSTCFATQLEADRLARAAIPKATGGQA